jgi:HEAT repeat protein
LKNGGGCGKRGGGAGFVLGFLLLCGFCGGLYPQDAVDTGKVEKSPDGERIETLRYGTESEIAALIQNLKTEKISSMDEELLALAETSRNSGILSGIFAFFAEEEKPGLKDLASKIVRREEDVSNETILAALDYLGKIKAADAVEDLRDLIEKGDSRFQVPAFRALGRVVSGEKNSAADEAAEYMADYYANRAPADENRRELILALGDTASSAALELLADITKNSDERPSLRIAALQSLAKIADPSSLEAVSSAVSSQDPNVRAAAMAALGPFSGEAVDQAILEGFRDSFYRTRIAAAQAARQRKLAAAAPYLRYRAEKDDVPAVKEEAIRALGAIGSGEAMEALETLFTEKKSSDRVRLAAAEALLENDGGRFAAPVIAGMDEAKRKNQTSLYNGFIRILGKAQAPDFEDLARRFFASGGVIEKSLALDLAVNNRFLSLESDIRSLTEDKNTGLARKAGDALSKLGVSQ